MSEQAATLAWQLAVALKAMREADFGCGCCATGRSARDAEALADAALAAFDALVKEE